MAEFMSSRFSGNDVLTEILNDPDTGTKKLQKNSEADAVRLVQEALYDLVWAQPFPGEDHYPQRVRFVDGDYGPTTERSVLAFKTKYRIVFPPGDPNGFIDGYTGPRTLEKLDLQIAHRDEIQEVIVEKVGELQRAGAPVRLFPIGDEPPPLQPWLGSGRYLRWWTAWGEDPAAETGVIVASSNDDAFEVHGPIFRRWWDLGGCTGTFGPPTSDVTADGQGGFVSTFSGGQIAVDAAGTVTEQPGPIAYQPPSGDDAIV